MNSRVSVALCTLDGGHFLSPQLNSLLTQTRLPDEVVACDDGSEDGTVVLLEHLSRRSPFPVRVVRNAFRQGLAGNFGQAMALCEGDFIALADQDDVWIATKLARQASTLTENKDAMAVFSDATVVNADLRSLGYTMWEQAGFGRRRQRLILADRPWEVLFKDPVATGATLMFRRDLLPLILPIPDVWVHDAWIAQIAASQGRLVAVGESLVLYRQHGANAIGGRKLPVMAQLGRAQALGRIGFLDRKIRRYCALRDRLRTFPTTTRRDVMLSMCDEKLTHLSRRRDVRSCRPLRVTTVFREWIIGNYRRFAKDWRNVAADLLMP